MRMDTKTEARAVDDARRHRQTDGGVAQRVAATRTCRAWFGPDFPAPSAHSAGRPQRNVERHHDTERRVVYRELDIVHQRALVSRRAEKFVAHALEQVIDRRKIDGDLVGEAVVVTTALRQCRRRAADRRELTRRIVSHRSPLTLRARSNVVKVARAARGC